MFIKRMRLIGKAHLQMWHVYVWKNLSCQVSRERTMAASKSESRQTLTTLKGEPIDQRKIRKRYSRQTKLEVVHFFHEHNLYQTTNWFLLSTKAVGRQIANEEKLKRARRHCMTDVWLKMPVPWSRTSAIAVCVNIGVCLNNCIAYKRIFVRT